MTEFEWRVEAVQTLLIEKGILTADEVRRQVEEMDSRSPTLGANVIARAWVDPAFKSRLLANAKSAILELGIDFEQEATLVAVENTDTVHHAVVCTLCSCYPRGLLGYPPDWYKSLNYRSRVVVDPRGVLREFGLELPPDVEVRVLDSTADMRYLVIPVRPAGTEGMSEQELASLVTRDSMIGVAQARTPALR
ncbi:MAG: nitrile hydratase subunit alpha [candidate division NC10 bacterium]